MTFTLLLVVNLAFGVLPSFADAAGPIFKSPSFFIDPASRGDDNQDDVPAIATDGSTWIVVWSSFPRGGVDGDILFSRSTDGGGTWTKPKPINTNAATDADRDAAPRIATDGQIWVVVWQSKDSLNGTKGDDYDILAAVSENNGDTWSDPIVVNHFGRTDTGDDEAPYIVTSGGKWLVVWASESQRTTVGGEGDIFYAFSSDGRQWGTSSPLNVGGTLDDAFTDVRVDAHPNAATDGDAWVVVWASDSADADDLGKDSDVLFSRLQGPGGTWTAPRPITERARADGELSMDSRPTVSTDGSNWIASWTSSDPLNGKGSDLDVVYMRSPDGEQWRNATAGADPSILYDYATTDVGADVDFRSISDGDSWVGVWASTDALGNAMLGTDYDILVSHSTDGGLVWTDPMALDTSRAASDPGDDQQPDIARSGGVLVVVWQSRDAFGSANGNDRDIRVIRGFLPPPGCGNGTKEGTEDCDDGNQLTGDGCRPDCRDEGCGNGFLDQGEECDHGEHCRSDCTLERCGDGRTDPGEECDDNDLENCDGCDSNCTDTKCGNGISCAPEACDDGNTSSCDGCDSSCRAETCGNGRKECAEKCDDGNITNCDGCDSNCTESGTCGNGIPCAPEGCDDGNLRDCDLCDSTCQTGCGSGVVCGNEKCDDGNSTPQDGCTNCVFDCDIECTDGAPCNLCAVKTPCTPISCIQTDDGLGRVCQEGTRREPCTNCFTDEDCKEEPDDPCTMNDCPSLLEGCAPPVRLTAAPGVLCHFVNAIGTPNCLATVVTNVQSAVDAAEGILVAAEASCPKKKKAKAGLARAKKKLRKARTSVGNQLAKEQITQECSDDLYAQLNAALGPLEGKTKVSVKEFCSTTPAPAP